MLSGFSFKISISRINTRLFTARRHFSAPTVSAACMRILQNFPSWPFIASVLYFLTHPVDGSNKIEIDATVEDENRVHEVKTDLPIVESPEDLLRHQKLTDIWENTERAIEWAKGEMNINTESSPYTVGPGFNQSLEKCQFPTHFNRLKQCFEKIAQLLSRSI